MMLFLTWLLVASSCFVSFFYLSVYRGLDEQEICSKLEHWPKVSLIMPAYNEEHVVGESLENVLNLDYPDYEVIFVDDNSEDDTLQEVRKFKDDKLNVLELPENFGKAGALNKALELVEGEFTVVHDADSVVEDGIIRQAVRKMSSNTELGGVIGRIQPLNENSFFRRLQITEYTLTNFYRRLMSRIDTLGVTPGPFSIYRTGDLKQLEGFDEGNLTEDLDVAWRLRKKGKSIGMVYRRTSYTELPKSFSSLKGQRVRWARGFMQNSRKHSGMFFNSEYGWFGKFQLPVQIIVPGVAVIGLGMILRGLGETVYNMYIQISATGLSFAMPQLNLWVSMLNIQWKIYVPLFVSLLITAYLLREAYRCAEKPVKYSGSLIFYFFAFFSVKAYFWSVAIFKELFGKSRVWT